jgi:hypothetical protein
LSIEPNEKMLSEFLNALSNILETEYIPPKIAQTCTRYEVNVYMVKLY